MRETLLNTLASGLKMLERLLMIGGLAVVSVTGWSVETGEDLLDRVKNAVVYIQHERASGTGFLVSADGYIWTNSHVVDSHNAKNPRRTAERIVVVLDSGEKYSAKVIGASLPFLQPDCALMKIDVNHPLPFLKMGDSSKMRVGQKVYAIGQPLGLKKTVTAGILSNTRRTGGFIVPILQMDATIDHGNSGGPLLNDQGDVIGINTYGLNQAGGLNGAFPINVLKDVDAMFRKNGHFQPIGLNLVLFDPIQQKTLERLGLPGGLIVSQVLAGTSAEKAGLKSGDIVTAMDGVPLKGSDDPMADLQEWLWSFMLKPAGTAMVLGVVRDADQAAKKTLVNISVSLEVLPLRPGEIPEKMIPELGLGLMAWTPWNSFTLRKTPVDCVAVSTVNAGGPLAKAGLAGGDQIAQVEGVKITSPEQCESELHKHMLAKKKWIRLVVYRNDNKTDLVIGPEYTMREKSIALVCPAGKVDVKEYERVRQHFERTGANIVVVGATRAPLALKTGESVTPTEVLESMESTQYQGFVFLDLPEGDEALDYLLGKDRVHAIMNSKRPVGAIGGAPFALMKAMPELGKKKLTFRAELLSKIGTGEHNYTGQTVERDEMFVTSNGAEDSMELFLGSFDQAFKRSLTR